MRSVGLSVCCLVALVGSVLFAQEPPDPPEARGPLSAALTATVGPLVSPYFDWASVADGSARPANGAGADVAKERSADWLSAVIRDRWLPADLPERLLPLEGEVPGHWIMGSEIVQYDAVRAHYELEGCPIWVTQTSFAIGIAVRPRTALEAAGTQATDHRQLMAATVRLFLNVPDEQVPLCLADTRTEEGVSEAVAGLDGEQWYHHLRCWTDGDTVLFHCPKEHDGGGMVFAVRWFEWLKRFAVEGK